MIEQAWREDTRRLSTFERLKSLLSLVLKVGVSRWCRGYTHGHQREYEVWLRKTVKVKTREEERVAGDAASLMTLWFNSVCTKGESVSTLIDADWHKQAFEGAPTDDSLWFGEIFSTNTGRELIPLRCFGLDYWLLFACPIQEAGSNEMLEQHTAVWARGFKPLEASRVIKFCRAEANDNHFSPEAWRLPQAACPFQFFQLLGKAIVAHADALPGIKQYFFLAASEALADVYVKRVFRYIDKSCLTGPFMPILEALGEFHGYQRP